MIEEKAHDMELRLFFDGFNLDYTCEKQARLFYFKSLNNGS